ncbi:glycosyltransferase family 4 protein [Paraburkholderia azotifigens]|uniref:Glycosyltransferase family 1 protein n=1 Tax=Paraburkholderia azotifigens TaxID=2057004 RepID=A0A5C6V4Y8_9BURK|nr:glycosyltransferase family 1 protein [Paraburkholderia azotifigens]TXC80207.1 glycosyltransferase family 4 protein [Paraburkholderia azotifigens]
MLNTPHRTASRALSATRGNVISSQSGDATATGIDASDEDFVINGKFMSQRMTGVQRCAYEFATALQRVEQEHRRFSVIVPVDATTASAPFKTRTAFSWLKGSLWEQLALPFASGRHILLSLCNVGPIIKRRHVVMIYDMAVFDAPAGYSRKFRWWYAFMFFSLKLNARHIVTVSEFSKSRIRAALAVPDSKVSVVKLAADHFGRIESDSGVISRLDLKKDRYGLAVGSLAGGKNHARLLAAIERLELRDDFKFVVAGGKNGRIFGNSTTRAGAEGEKVVWAGYVSDSELKALYENAAFFVFPSLYEGFGLPPLEAMYCGCPVIVSREASLPEVCGDAAVYCDAYSVEDIAEKMTAMMNDAQMRAMYRTRGREHAGQFQWSKSASRLLDTISHAR